MMKICKIEKLPDKRDVYSIYSSETGNYVTDGVVSKNCGLMDEVDFFPKTKNVMGLYTQIRRRINSRFMYRGRVDGKLVLLSSKKSTSDFLENYIEKTRRSPDRRSSMYLVSKAIWEVKPEAYPEKRFPVAVGNKYLASLVLNDNDDLSMYIDKGYKIIYVPESLRLNFEDDIITSLADYAGIAMDHNQSFISPARVKDCVQEGKPNPWDREILEIGETSTSNLYDFFDPSKIDPIYKRKKLYIHVDTAISGDLMGLSACVIDEDIVVMEIPGITKAKKLRRLIGIPIFYIALKALDNDKLPFYKVKEFISYLSAAGFNVERVSSDSFQSFSLLQDIRMLGYKTVVISMDRTMEPYLAVKSAIHENRLQLYHHELLESELENLIEDKLTRKVDHPSDGSKDLSDAVGGSYYNAFTSEEGQKILTSMEFDYYALLDEEMTEEKRKLLELSLRELEKSSGSTDLQHRSDIKEVSNLDKLFDTSHLEDEDDYDY